MSHLPFPCCVLDQGPGPMASRSWDSQGSLSEKNGQACKVYRSNRRGPMSTARRAFSFFSSLFSSLVLLHCIDIYSLTARLLHQSACHRFTIAWDRTYSLPVLGYSCTRSPPDLYHLLIYLSRSRTLQPHPILIPPPPPNGSHCKLYARCRRLFELFVYSEATHPTPSQRTGMATTLCLRHLPTTITHSLHLLHLLANHLACSTTDTDTYRTQAFRLEDASSRDSEVPTLPKGPPNTAAKESRP